ncbi:MAG: 16S rRNA (adenine(1518)-N(6)/adenine(1519)-N(6))-dimethyltransferase RsmA [Clostridia bacterium]|nr:16S rRNA (adenine(1518)-N(6)/adenine(1519)-N(6))-dimethyltransferase RsmA [Clostridia bacterium]
MNLCDPKTIRDVMTVFGLSFRHNLGQNFLTDPAIVERIAESSVDGLLRPVTVLEIGAGFGALTKELSAAADEVVAVEIDKGLIPLLGYTLSGCSNVRLVCADITKTDVGELLGDAFGKGSVSVCANLPYYITTPILLELLESRLPFASVTLMIQSEVADRLCAAPGEPEYGSVTAYLNYFGTCERLFTVPPSKFIPAPKVESTVVRIRLHKEPPVTPADEGCFFKVIRAAFGQRRKTLLNALSAVFTDFDKSELKEILEEAEIDPGVRGERLGITGFADVADAIAVRCKDQ